ncbi:MAG: AAA family ATPase [Terrimicrobiaceae bacterium]|nr:AAA family ATPase [Terrimicrobiaceae bacterium]
MNTTTPRVFVAATEQNVGKTTTSLGLYATLRRQFRSIGFIKPVGQRFIEIEGKRIDEDSVLIRDTFDTQIPIEDMSPIAVEPDFTRRYIEASNSEYLARRIQNSFDRATWEKEFAIIEGTGHAGVGSVFDLSNARVARLLESKVILVTTGGIGRPIDEANLNKALFDAAGVEVIGVVMNKVLMSKYEYIADFARRGFARLGLELLGVIPQERMLSEPTLQDVCGIIRGEVLAGAEDLRSRAGTVMIGAMQAANVLRRLEERTLLIVPGDREDVLLAAIADARDPHVRREHGIVAIVLSESLRPEGAVAEMIRKAPFPIIASPMDSYTIASRIHSMTVKTLPGDSEKIDRIQSLVSEHVDVDRILEKIGAR